MQVPFTVAPRKALTGQTSNTSNGNQILLVMMDLYLKLMKAVPPTMTTVAYNISLFMNYWTILYSIPGYVLMENGAQFTTKFLQLICAFFGPRHLMITVYLVQTNGQAKRCNEGITARLRHQVAGDQRH